MMTEPYKSAHRDCGSRSARPKRVLESGQVGCFYGLSVFAPTEMAEWTPNECALCPDCGIDSVLPEPTYLSPEFFEEMNKYWFWT